MSDEQIQDFQSSQCVILQYQGQEGSGGLPPEAEAFSEFLDAR